MHAQWENSIFAEYVVTCKGAIKLPFIYAQVHTLMILLTLSIWKYS